MVENGTVGATVAYAAKKSALTREMDCETPEAKILISRQSYRS